MELYLYFCHFVSVGEVWETVEPPTGKSLKQISVGCFAIWGLDSAGQLWVRREVTPVFPEGTHWQAIPTTASDMGNYGKHIHVFTQSV
jgi:hypothetical protein